MDSIRENRTKDDILTEIRLERSEDIWDEKCFIIVEGADDALFVQRVFSDNVVCKESFAGKMGVQQIIEDEECRIAHIIGIRDKDYMDEEELPERLFLYDHCCLEMMLLAEPNVAMSFRQVYYKKDSVCKDFVLNAMRQLAAYSILRKKNEREGLGISFQKAGLGGLIDLSKETLDDVGLFQRVKASERYEGCRQEADELAEGELWEITNGHDICAFLGYLSEINKNKMKEAGVRSCLLAGYRAEDFGKTRLYQNILNYQRQRHLRFLE